MCVCVCIYILIINIYIYRDYKGVSENMGLARSYVNFEMASEDELRLTTVYVEKHKLWLVIAIH